MDIEEGGYQDWAADVEPGDANSYPTEDSIEHVYVVVTDKHSGEVYEGKLFLKSVTREPEDKASPEGETLAKRQEEYWDSVKEEQSRQLLRQLRAGQQEWKFRCKDEGGF